MRRTDKEDAEKALIDAGIPEPIVKSGSKAIAKEVTPDRMPLLYALMAAETYLRFVLKRRDYKYIVSTGNAAKPMIGIDVNDLDKNEFLINTPYATYDLRKGLDGEQPHDPRDLITKITTCAPGDGEKQYSKIKFDTVSLCDNVKMAKAKDQRAAMRVGAVQISIRKAPRERRGGHACKIAKWKVKI